MTDVASSRVTRLRPATESRTVRTRSTNDAARGRKHLTRDEVHRLIRAAKKGRQGRRDALMIRLAFEHGLRVSELIALKWQHLDLASGHTLTIQRAKGSLDGTHPLQGETVRALKRYQNATQRRDGFVFVSERGAPVSVAGFRKMLARLSERVLGVPWHPHALRHACGVHLINSGTDIRTVQQYLGHANIQNTVAYTALSGRPFERLTF
ncbi:tyrosine-type recombinase/integrase [Halomonas cibimaris]|uniref:Tyrosine-type recombinase/integrase n=1 Tax=Halomonas cibimaris TaxID=657012 RepID=A0ABP7LAG7_9GAMM